MDIQILSKRPVLQGLSTRHPQIEFLAIGLLLALFTFLAHGYNLGGSWRWDDGAHLGYAVTFSPLQYFFNPDITRLHSGANLTPWNAFFYDINLHLFGMNTAGHYSHMLLVLFLAALVFYAVLRQWLPLASALLGAAALLLGKPTLHIAAGLMHGHYATGLLFSLLAILGWTRHFKNGGRYWLVLSVLAYLLAVTCKEVYVPLVVLLPFLPIGTLWEKIRPLLPYLLIAAAYAGWRYLVLGSLIGGYGRGSFDAANTFRQFLDIPRLLLGTRLPGMLWASVFCLLLGWAAYRRRIAWPLFAITATATLLPLVPLTAFPGINQADRYLFVPWVALSALLAGILPQPRRHRTFGYLPHLLILLSLLPIHRQEKREIKPHLAYWDSFYRFALSADKTRQALFVGPDDEGYKRLVLSEARSAADRLKHPPAGGGRLLIIDQIGVNLLQARQANMEIFEMVDRVWVPMSEERLAQHFPKPPRFAEGIPLQVELRLHDKKIHWKFGPHDGGHYYASPKNHPDPTVQTDVGFYVPQQGQYRWMDVPEVRLSFCHIDTKAGTIACSPVLTFDFNTGETLTWSGTGQYGVLQ